MAIFAGHGRERGVSGDTCAFGELVPAIGTRAGQCFLESLPAPGRRRLGSDHGLAARGIWMEADVGPGRHPSVFMAAGLVVWNSRSSPGGQMDFCRREVLFGTHAGKGGGGTGSCSGPAAVAKHAMFFDASHDRPLL